MALHAEIVHHKLSVTCTSRISSKSEYSEHRIVGIRLIRKSKLSRRILGPLRAFILYIYFGLSEHSVKRKIQGFTYVLTLPSPMDGGRGSGIDGELKTSYDFLS